MVSVLQVASYICQRYMEKYGVRIDEMKLHKLLYFTQRECLVQTQKPMFTETFKAWKYGPVMLEIRQHYKDDSLNLMMSDQDVAIYQKVFDVVFDSYSAKKSWSLSSLTHGEYSWQKAREGYGLLDSCDVDIKTADIAIDADRIRVRKFLLSHLSSKKYLKS